MWLRRRHSNDAPDNAAARGDGLARDLSVVLVVKVLILFALWYAFFHHPDAPSLTPQAVQQRLLDVAADTPTHSPVPQEAD